jgi:2-dehydro-3-deoxygluconokinase
MASNGGGRIVCFGETLLRLSAPDRGVMFQVPKLDAHFGGAETNVAVALARMGRASALVTRLPGGMIGDAALDAVRRYGVDVSGVARAPGRLGLYYLASGAGLRAASVVYDRAGSAFALARTGEFDWPALLDGAAWLHLSGITPALGSDSAELALEAVQAAKAAGARVSFDGNYRARLWESWSVDPGPVLCALMDHVDLLFGNGKDISLLLGRTLPDDSADARRAAAMLAFERFPRLSWIASTTRVVAHADQHSMAARIDTRDGAVLVPPVDVGGVVDRIGSGDAFAAGVLLAEPEGPEQAARTGLALAVLKHYTAGDFSLSGPAELDAFLAGARDVRR